MILDKIQEEVIKFAEGKELTTDFQNNLVTYVFGDNYRFVVYASSLEGKKATVKFDGFCSRINDKSHQLSIKRFIRTDKADASFFKTFVKELENFNETMEVTSNCYLKCINKEGGYDE